MRLSLHFLKKLAPGKITTGKHRFIRPIRNFQKVTAVENSIREQRNMVILDKCFLSGEEERCLKKVILESEKLKQKESEKIILDKKLMFESRTLLSHLDILNSSRAWE